MLNKDGVEQSDRKQFQLCAAIARGKTTADFQKFIEYLADLQDSVDRKMRKATSPQLEWYQGKAQLLDDLLTFVDNAAETRDKLKQKTEA